MIWLGVHRTIEYAINKSFRIANAQHRPFGHSRRIQHPYHFSPYYSLPHLPHCRRSATAPTPASVDSSPSVLDASPPL